MARIFFVIVGLFYTTFLYGQSPKVFRAIIWHGDTIAHVWLDEAVARTTVRSNNWYRRQQRQNTRLEYNVRKVYPYACMAAEKIAEIERKLTATKKESERKKILKEEYGQLMKAFKAPLTKLSITQGRILIRLIYRETNQTSFTHIREYRGTVNAYFWQSIALLFGNNLKTAYNPYGEDYEIEEIVQKIIQENKK